MNVQCCVAGCPHASGVSAQSQGITFHELPKRNIMLRVAWLKALNKYPPLVPQEDVSVCSVHFDVNDFTVQQGTRKLKPSAIPVINKTEEASSISNLKIESTCFSLYICRICLAIDKKLLSISKYKLDTAYEELTGVCLDEDILPKYLCVECAQRLINCSRFRQKSFEAYLSLIELDIVNGQVTLRSVKCFKRKRKAINKLTPYLEKKSYEANHYDYSFDGDTLEDNKEFVKELIDTTNNESKDILYTDVTEIKTELNCIDDEVKDDVDNFNYDDNLNDDDNFNDDDNYIVVQIEEEVTNENKKRVRQREKTPKIAITELNDCNIVNDDNLALNTLKIIDIVKEKKKYARKGRKKPKEEKPNAHVSDLNHFTITKLTFEEQISYVMSRRDSDNYKKSLFQCTFCNRGYFDKQAFDNHMKRHTDVYGKAECKVCHLRYRTEGHVRNHAEKFHTTKYSCDLCPYVNMNKMQARLHERWHKGTQYKCPQCDYVFVNRSSYMTHIRVKHPSDCVCELCGYSFVSERGIVSHKNLIHRLDNHEIPEDGPLCEECNIRFVSEEALKKHLSVSPKHKTEKKMQANDRQSRTKRKYYKPSKKPRPCEQCGMQLETYREYTKHFMNMHKDKNRTHFSPSVKDRAMCDQCGRIFQSAVHLRYHYSVHTGKKPFKCDICDKAYTTKMHLTYHKTTHEGVPRKKFPCHLCGRSFTMYSNRQRHMKFFHTDARPFKCEMCEKSFKSDPEKRLHINHVHLKNPWPKRKRGKERRTSIIPSDGMEDQDTSLQDSEHELII